MKKQFKQLICLVVILVLFVVGYVISIYKVDNVEILDQVSVTSVIKTDVSSVKSVTYIHDSVTVSLERDGDKWVLSDDKSFDLDQDKAADIVNYATNLNARTKLEDPSDLSEYGLDDPSYVVSFTDAQGVERVYYIGDQFAIDGTYFAKVEGDDTIYTVTEYYPNAFITDKEQLKAQGE